MEKRKKQTYDLEERLLEYPVRIIKIVEQQKKMNVQHRTFNIEF